MAFIYTVMVLAGMEMVMATGMAMVMVMVANMEAGITWKIRKAFYWRSGDFSVIRQNIYRHAAVSTSVKTDVTEGSEAVGW